MSNKIEALEEFKKLQANRGYPVPEGYIMNDVDYMTVREIHFIDEQMMFKEERDRKWNALSKEEQEKIKSKRDNKEYKMYEYLHKTLADFRHDFLCEFPNEEEIVDDFLRDS